MTINEAAVTDRRIAIGATEKAVCVRLRELARGVPADQAIVELGVFRGRTTGWLALGASEGHGARITSVDPWDLRKRDTWPADYPASDATLNPYGERETYDAFKAHLDQCGITYSGRDSQVEIRRGYGVNVGARWTKPVGLIWHDAEHGADAVAADLEAWARHVVPGGYVVLHDAANPRFGVVEGAGRVLDDPEWDWAGRELMRWRKKPDRRGALIVRKHSDV